MTADVELLRMPDLLKVWVGAHACDKADTAHAARMVTDYARANVLHHTAAQAAEIEALRAEVDRLNDLCNGLHRSLIDSQAGYVHYRDRAERLAEALRELLELRDLTQRGEVHPTRHELDVVRDARALLRTRQPAAVDGARRVMHELCDCPSGRAEHARWCAALAGQQGEK